MELSATTVINRPVNEVFAYVIDLSNDVHWRKSVDESEMRSGQALEVGGLGYSRVRGQEIDWRIVSYEPNKSVTWEMLNGPFLGHGGYRAAPVERGTQFTLYADIEPVGVFRLLGPVFGWMGQRGNQADVEKLKQILEAEDQN